MKFLDIIQKMDVRNIIALLAILLSFIFLFLLLYVKIPVENKDIINVSTGFVVGTCVTAIMGYFFTSTKTNKTE